MKLSKIFGLFIATVAIMSLGLFFVACPSPTTTEETTTTTLISVDAVYMSGYDGGSWASDDSEGEAKIMTTTDKKVFTYAFTWDKDDNSFAPYGFKFTTKKGWNGQITADWASKNTPKTTLNKTMVSFDGTTASVGPKVYDKTTVEAGTSDDNSKFYPAFKCVKGESYTITLDFSTSKPTVKIVGKAGASLRAVIDSTKGFQIVGSINSWNNNSAADLMKKVSDTEYNYEFTLAAAGTPEFKILNENGTWDFGMAGAKDFELDKAADLTVFGGDNCKPKAELAAGTYVITLTFTNGTTTASVKVSKK